MFRGVSTKESVSPGVSDDESISPGISTDPDALEYYAEILESQFEDDDTASVGHLMLREQRQVLYYLRLIEHEMPKLVGKLVAFRPLPATAYMQQHTANLLCCLPTRLWSFVRWTMVERSTLRPQSASSLLQSITCH
jgi:hypothetical protein